MTRRMAVGCEVLVADTALEVVHWVLVLVAPTTCAASVAVASVAVASVVKAIAVAGAREREASNEVVATLAAGATMP